MTGSSSTSYVYGPGGLVVEQIAGSTPSWYHHDQLGSTRVVTSTTGAINASYTFDAYGRTLAHTGLASFQYAGQYTDAETGLQYLRARYYDSATGQLLSHDPAVALTRSAYGYVAGNPLNGADPSGLCWGPDVICNAVSDVVSAATTVGSGVVSGVAQVGSYAYDHSAGIATGCSLFVWAPVVGEVAAGCALGFGALTAAKGVAHGDLSETLDGAFSAIPGYGALAGWSGRSLRAAYVLELAAWTAFETGPNAQGHGVPPPPTPDLVSADTLRANGC